MKKLLLPITLLLFMSFAPAKMTPQEYNDAIIGEQNKITKIMLDMANYFDKDLNKADQLREELVKQCQASVSVLKALPAYEGDVKFRDSGIALYTFYGQISAMEYKEMIDILKKENIEASDIERLGTLEKQITDRETPLDNDFQNAQSAFAKKHGFILIDNEYQKDIDEMGK